MHYIPNARDFEIPIAAVHQKGMKISKLMRLDRRALYALLRRATAQRRLPPLRLPQRPVPG